MRHLLTRGVTLVASLILLFSIQLNAQPGTDINGHNVTLVKYTQNGGGHFMANGNGTWVEVTSSQRLNFKETGRDDWSVYLRDDNRNISVQLDLWMKMTYLTPDGQEKGELYPITEASNAANNDSGGALSGYEKCATEGETITLSKPTDVAYGAQGKFVFKKAMTGTVTFNNGTFGDPAPGVRKSGFCKDTPVQNSPAGYDQCATEGETITLSKPTDVAYGAQGKFVYKKGLTGSVTFNNATFGDPAPGVRKSGFCKDAPIPDSPEGYDKCAKEGESITLSKPTDVAYGAKGKFVYKEGLTGKVTFNNATFGDPAPGVRKSGFCKESSIAIVDPPKVDPVDDDPSDEVEEVEEVVWDMNEKDLRAITSWIKSRVASVRVPYCYRDSYGRGAGSVPSACANSSLEKDKTGGPAGLCYPKCKSGYSGVGPVCWQSCPTNFRDDGAFCRKPDEYGRGVGRIPDQRPCSDWNSKYRDDGTSCWLDTYGRGTGYDFFFKDGMKNCEKDHGKGNCEMWGAIAYPKCKKGYKNVACCLCEPKGGPGIKVTAFERYKCRSNEELNGALCYPKCKPGYHAVGCCVCSYDCPPGFGADMGVSCTKKTYGRGVGELSTCPPNLIRDETGGPAGLCFPRCKSGYHGVGPVCWMNCPPGLTACGAGCAASDFDCASTTFDQVFSVAIATANIATLGLSKPATTGLKAGQTAVKVGSKVFVTSSKIGKYSAKAMAALQQVDDGVKTKKIIVRYLKQNTHNPGKVITEVKSWTVEAYDAYKLYEEEYINTQFVNQTSADINRELNSKLRPEYAQTVKKYYARVALAEFAENELGMWDVAQYGLLAAGMADPTGLVDVAASFAHPVCDTVEPFPKLSSVYLK